MSLQHQPKYFRAPTAPAEIASEYAGHKRVCAGIENKVLFVKLRNERGYVTTLYGAYAAAWLDMQESEHGDQPS